MSSIRLPIDIETVKGFLRADEGEALYRGALEVSGQGACLEIGSYCGKSTVYFGLACQEQGSVLYALDHHLGSEENQAGWEHHDESLADPETGMLNTFPLFRRTLRRASLEDTVVPIVAPSKVAARHWATPLAMVFIDGGHAMEHALNDYRLWAPKVIPGGILAIHDVFPNPADGGRPPFEIYKMALASNLFEEIEAVASLRLLRRLG
ncbi:MAG: class I SAM-dependent methyltransferase [Alphaproteobacteria bacterium]|nr:class I SAM-dependent methyltransferase [Alphaproteobacteria bacterium]MBO6627438.1 class I SAM-dependent methyltransferase [Alphaproteobacteria bacterium]MDF1627076.1 class I SAM-dependent methyltransferase [Parvibaculaceae bacterium]